MELDQIRWENEISHGKFLSEGATEKYWGWETPAGKIRAKRRGRIIAESAGLTPEMRVLEIGCGTGLFTEIFSNYGSQLTAVDISPDLLKKAHRRNFANPVDFKEGRFEEFDFEEGFDAIIGSSVLHHLNLKRSLNRIYSLLKPGGIMCFAEPNYVNPQVAVMFKFRYFFPEISPDENPFLRWQLRKNLIESNFENLTIKPFDWLHPSTPHQLINIVSYAGKLFEQIPFLREFAGSLLIKAQK